MIEQQNTEGSKRRLIIVAYRLPFKIVNENGYTELRQNSGGLVSAVLSLVGKQKDSFFDQDEKIQWIGFSDNTREELEGQNLANESFQAHPVFIPDKINENYYEVF